MRGSTRMSKPLRQPNVLAARQMVENQKLREENAKLKRKAIASARLTFVLVILFWIVTEFLFSLKAEAAEKKWHLSEVQYQISDNCSHDVKLYSKQAAVELSKHSVVFTEGLDAVSVSCEFSNPFESELRYLEPGTESEIEYLVLGATRTTWYTATLQIFRAHIWIDPLNAPVFGDLRGVVFHEWIHAIGEGHTPNGIMAASAEGDYIDAATVARIRSRYGKRRASVLDSQGDYFLPCLFVPSVLASLVGASEGFYWVQTKAGEITDFGVSEC